MLLSESAVHDGWLEAKLRLPVKVPIRGDPTNPSVCEPTRSSGAVTSMGYGVSEGYRIRLRDVSSYHPFGFSMPFSISISTITPVALIVK